MIKSAKAAFHAQLVWYRPRRFATGMKPKRYIVRLRDGAERAVVAKSYRTDDAKQAYIFLDNDDVEDQFVAFASVDCILLDEPSSAFPTDERFRVIHEEIHREHALISNRMNWFVTSQAFLVAAFCR